MSDTIVTYEEKCQGCNRCLRNCPVFGANISYTVAGAPKVKIDHQKCIQCGHCIQSCEHEARDYIDDTERFFADLAAGKAIAVLAAPAVRTNFDNYRQLFGYFKECGVMAVYDVSLGADITTWAYLKVIATRKLTTVIAQPCPPVVNYLERHQPEQLQQLAPVHSPMMCTAIYLKKYTSVRADLAFLSPCLGKREEILDPNTHGMVKYNVTFKKLQAYLKNNHVVLNGCKQADYDEIGRGLGFLYSRPGGLRENVEAQGANAWVRQIEGTGHVYNYLNEYGKRVNNNQTVPLLVDALNCTYGCNLGTGTCHNIALDDIDYRFNQMKTARLHETEKSQTPADQPDLGMQFDRDLKIEDFYRNYTNKQAGQFQREPTTEECRAILVKMHKTTHESQTLNCAACGYHSCMEMARAIYHGINQPTGCLDYNRQEIKFEKEQLEAKTIELASALDNLEQLGEERTKRSEYLKQQVAEITASLQEVAQCSGENAKAIELISHEVQNIVTMSGRLRESVNTMQEKVVQFAKASETIVAISRETDLVAVNARIEAARSGLAGRGFAVIAQSVKALSQQSKQIAESTLNDQTVMNQMIKEIYQAADELEQRINNANLNIINVSNMLQEVTAKDAMISVAATDIVKYEQTPEK